MVISRALPIEDGYASSEEAALAIAALADADLARLARVAKLRSEGLRDTDWEDLLHEAVRRVLDGSRRWPSTVPFPFFLREVIRSLASDARRRMLPLHEAGEDEADGLANVVSDQADPERAAVARNLVATVQGLFAGDATALGIIEGIADGLSPADIQRRVGISPTDYESARRRIRRKLASLPPEAI